MTTLKGISNPQHPQLLSVSKLTQQIKILLEENYPIIWIFGEISNLRLPSSGHAYFSLKDETAQIAAVFFKGQLNQLKFNIADGMSIIGMGRISVYEPRGTYQIILEYAEPQGFGALQLAFEQLKSKLAQEGLFAVNRKKKLPFLPARIGLITSPSGAVIHDLLTIIYARFPNLEVDIFPVRVQGKGAERDIVRALSLANVRSSCDVIVLARGGGSLEDLAPFNSEIIARAIVASRIPVVSAIGHETDFTIADFVADARAPTPSAAAQMLVPIKIEVNARITNLQFRCVQFLNHQVELQRRELSRLTRSLVHPSKKIQDLQMRIDDLSDRLSRAAVIVLQLQKATLEHMTYSLMKISPRQRIIQLQALTEKWDIRLQHAIRVIFKNYKQRYSRLLGMLTILNPKAVLQKGYSITRTIPHRLVVTSAGKVSPMQALEIVLARGRLQVMVKEKTEISED